MRTFSGKRSTLALAIAAVTAMSGWVVAPQASAAGFIDDSTLTGGIYYWQRERDRKDVTDGDIHLKMLQCLHNCTLFCEIYRLETFMPAFVSVGTKEQPSPHVSCG